MLIDVGQVIAKKYALARLLGRGSMGEVWSAHHQALGEMVALKVLTWPPAGEDAEDQSVALARFRFEAQVAARLSRKTRHIAQVTDYGEDDGIPYLVMELLDGEALDAALRERGTLPLVAVAPIVSQIARALEQAHAEAVAHRDLKPANVFLSRDEERQLLVKLLDFGIARPIHAQRVQGTYSTAKGFVFGTPGYMSPEQTRASPKLDHRCDLWALATIAYQALTGHLPVDGGDTDEIMKNLCAGRIIPLRQRDASLPAAVGAFFERAFADRIDDRFGSASQLAQAFELACASTPSSMPVSAPSTPETGNTGTEFSATVAQEVLHAHRGARARMAAMAGGALIAASIVLGGVWRSLSSPRPRTEAPPAATTAADSSETAHIGPPPAPAVNGETATATSDSLAAPVASSAPSPPRIHSTLPAGTAAPRVRPKPLADPSPARSPRPSEDRNDVF